MIKDYIKETYPYWIRKGADIEWSVTDKYDTVRWEIFDLIDTDIKSSAKELVITTATEIWITEWEIFLKIPTDPFKTLEERRSTLLWKIFWGNATLAVLKTIVYGIVWGDETNVVFYENWTSWTAVWDEVFSYELRINSWAVKNTFSPATLEETLKLIHPFHCNVILLTNYSPFSWVSQSAPWTDPYLWVDQNYPYEWSYWS